MTIFRLVVITARQTTLSRHLNSFHNQKTRIRLSSREAKFHDKQNYFSRNFSKHNPNNNKFSKPAFSRNMLQNPHIKSEDDARFAAQATEPSAILESEAFEALEKLESFFSNIKSRAEEHSSNGFQITGESVNKALETLEEFLLDSNNDHLKDKTSILSPEKIIENAQCLAAQESAASSNAKPIDCKKISDKCDKNNSETKALPTVKCTSGKADSLASPNEYETTLFWRPRQSPTKRRFLKFMLTISQRKVTKHRRRQNALPS